MGKKIIIFIGLIASIITILTALVAIFKLIINPIINLIKENYYQTFTILVIIVLLIVIDIIIRCFMVLKFRALSWGRLQSYLTLHQFANEIKNSSYNILGRYKKNKLTIEFIEEERNRIIKNVLERLCKVFHKTIGYEVRSCMKILGFQGNDNNEIQIIDRAKLTSANAVVETKFRSKNSTDVNEDANEPKKVDRNTDFAEILFEFKDYFYSGNLPEYEKALNKVGKKYKNTTANWEKYYRATIVVPIRISNEENDKEYQIMGFLCVDTMSTTAFKHEEEEIAVSIVKTFADGLYAYLDHCRHFDKLLENVNKKGGI